MNDIQLLAYFDTQGILYQNYIHEPAFTCEEMEQLAKMLPPFSHCKNLFLKDRKKRYWLLTALVETQIDLKALAKELAAPELRFARPDELEQFLGVKPGSVTLFAIINDVHSAVNILLDAAVLKAEKIGLHPLRNDMTTVMSPQGAIDFLKSQRRIFEVLDL